jgi:hypothetical protein
MASNNGVQGCVTTRQGKVLVGGTSQEPLAMPLYRSAR